MVQVRYASTKTSSGAQAVRLRAPAAEPWVLEAQEGDRGTTQMQHTDVLPKRWTTGCIAVAYFSSLWLFLGCPTNEQQDDDDVSNDDDTADDDDDTSGDDDTNGDDDTGDDDEEGCGDDDTADGWYLRRYEGTAHLEIDGPALGKWSLDCATWATAGPTVMTFKGEIDCSNPLFSGEPLEIQGVPSTSSLCIDGHVVGTLVDGGSISWYWIGEISEDNLHGQINAKSPDGTVVGTFDLPALAVSIIFINPEEGPISGSTEVELFGSGFSNQVEKTTVLFGGNEATVDYTQHSGSWDTAMVTTPPANSPGPVDITIENQNGIFSLINGFAYTSE
jgi:IPT/TIG domain